MAPTLAELVEVAREEPVGAVLDFGSLALAIVLPVTTFVLLALGDPWSNPLPWIALIVVGAGFASLWTLWYPLYDELAGRR